MKLTILGGGGFRTPYVWQALLRDVGSPRVTEVALYDIDGSRLATMAHILDQLGRDFPNAPKLTLHAELVPALTGARFVFAAVRVGGTEARCCDERVALDQNVLGQETTGPGGLAYALRSIPAMLHIAEAMQQVAPDAYLLNFTNPAGMVTEALQIVLGDRVIGICDTPSGLGRRIATLLGHDHARVDMDYVGLNHLGWMRRVLVDGVDVLQDLIGDDAKLGRLEEGRVFGTDWIRALGVIPNEYLYYTYFNRDAIRAIAASPQTRGEFLVATQAQFFRDAGAGGADTADLWADAVAERSASYMAEATGGAQGAPSHQRGDETDPSHLGYAGVALGVMSAISRNEPQTMILNVRNRGTIHGLPDDAVVEVPTLVDMNGARPLALDAQPDLHQLGLMQQVKASERHVIAAARSGSKTEALLAFALHPLVDSVSVAGDLLDEYVARIPEVAAVLAQ